MAACWWRRPTATHRCALGHVRASNTASLEGSLDCAQCVPPSVVRKSVSLSPPPTTRQVVADEHATGLKPKSPLNSEPASTGMWCVVQLTPASLVEEDRVEELVHADGDALGGGEHRIAATSAMVGGGSRSTHVDPPSDVQTTKGENREPHATQVDVEAQTIPAKEIAGGAAYAVDHVVPPSVERRTTEQSDAVWPTERHTDDEGQTTSRGSWYIVEGDVEVTVHVGGGEAWAAAGATNVTVITAAAAASVRAASARTRFAVEPLDGPRTAPALIGRPPAWWCRAA